jgi:Trypsin-co-occurring domain 1
MQSRTQTVSIQLDDKTMVKVEASAPSGDQDVLDFEKVMSFKEVTDTIQGVASAVLPTLQKAGPTKASVAFGVQVGVESGALTTMLVKGTANGNLMITLEWDKSQ